MGTEVDLPWTYVASTRRLIDTLLVDPRLVVLEGDPPDFGTYGAHHNDRPQGWVAVP